MLVDYVMLRFVLVGFVFMTFQITEFQIVKYGVDEFQIVNRIMRSQKAFRKAANFLKRVWAYSLMPKSYFSTQT